MAIVVPPVQDIRDEFPERDFLAGIALGRDEPVARRTKMFSAPHRLMRESGVVGHIGQLRNVRDAPRAERFSIGEPAVQRDHFF